MTQFFRKIQFALTLSMLTSIGYAYGDDNNSLFYGQSQDCCACKPTCRGIGFFSAELLYWRTFQSGLDICVPTDVSDTITSDGKVISKFSGKGRDPHFDWNPGYRLGVGYGFANSNWGVGAIWTHFDSKAHDSKNRDNEFKWNINYDVIDVVAIYECDFGSCFSLIPFVGLRGARIDQKQHISAFPCSDCYSVSPYTSMYYTSENDNYYSDSYQIGDYSSSDSTAMFNSSKEKFLGIGPLIGVEADWIIGCGFSFYLRGSVAWMYGNFHLRFVESESTSDTYSSCEVRKHLDASVVSADAGLGIRWQTCICENMQLIFQLGLEHHRYFDFNRIGSYGDLSFDGVNLSAGIEF